MFRISTPGGAALRRSEFIFATVFCLAATLAHAAGVRFFDVPAETAWPTLTGAVWYPCAGLPDETKVGNSMVIGTKDCPIAGNKLPLIVVSHGRAGWFGGHHDTAAALADAGFVVAAINHPGDNSSDKTRVDDLSILVGRPADIKRLVDFMLGAWPDAPKIDRDRIGIFGFSMGGYTGLVLIGGNPDLRKGLAGCEGSSFRACEQLRDNEIPAGPPVHDPRIKAAVIIDPAPAFFFQTDDLKEAKVPVQLWSSDPKLSADHVSGCCAIGINRRLPSKPDYHLVSNAIHFSFLARCSPQEVRDFPRICIDAPDFDRVGFHKNFHADVVAFFRKHLIEPARP
jgi:predicted dienelactone hydrolase